MQTQNFVQKLSELIRNPWIVSPALVLGGAFLMATILSGHYHHVEALTQAQMVETVPAVKAFIVEVATLAPTL